MLEFKDKKEAIDWLKKEVKKPELNREQSSLLNKFVNQREENNYFLQTDIYLKETQGELYYDWKSLNTLTKKTGMNTEKLQKLTSMIEQMDNILEEHGKIKATMLNYQPVEGDIFGTPIRGLVNSIGRVNFEKFTNFKSETVGKIFRKRGFTDAYMDKESVQGDFPVIYECVVPQSMQGIHYLTESGLPKVILKRNARVKIIDISIISNPTNSRREMIKVHLTFLR